MVAPLRDGLHAAQGLGPDRRREAVLDAVGKRHGLGIAREGVHGDLRKARRACFSKQNTLA